MASTLTVRSRRPKAKNVSPCGTPATGQAIASTADASAQDVDRAVMSAWRAFVSRSWAGRPPADRERVLLRFADLVEQHGEELAQLETLEQGKSINISRAFEVGCTLNWMRYTAGLTTKISGRTLDVSIPFPQGARYQAWTKKEPVGVVAGIVPWNFPLMIGMWKVMPALAAGCSIVIKPSETTPLTLLRVAELATEAGIPDGIFNVVTGSGAECGAALTSHPTRCQGQLYRFNRNRQTDCPRGSRPPDSRYSGTGGQKPGHRAEGRGPAVGYRRADDRQLPQPGAGVCC
ncbi:Phenylacetaldehyde dehydrogenase [Kluyvera cryocrescens]|uniref:Phenylacetaldehyde dehydrogenase n=1 Tax=Kluyvera cryocrescens TaxID=580 RepID=A0A485AAL6_KLUCR|nr:Phenylacetaldehyde dehydrogenase [Kluyvera cryocrescens]